MSDILGGESFSDGEQVTGARLNNHVNGAVIQPSFVVSKTLMSTADLAGNDSLLVYDLSAPAGTNLKRTTVTNLLALSGLGTVTSVGLSLPTDTFTLGGPVTTAGTLTATYDNQTAGKVHIGPVATTGLPTWRRLEPRDMRSDAVNVASSAIDWNLGNVFYKILSGAWTPNFTNNVAGRVIQLLIGQGAPGTHFVNWVGMPEVLWPGGVGPIQTTGTGKWDWYQFTQYNTYVFGTRIGANMDEV